MSCCGSGELAVRVGNIGVVFEVDVIDQDGNPVDISNAVITTRQIIFVKPRIKTRLAKTGVLVNDGTDGKMKYTSVSGDLDEVGVYKIQASIVFVSGATLTTDIGTFEVAENL